MVQDLAWVFWPSTCGPELHAAHHVVLETRLHTAAGQKLATRTYVDKSQAMDPLSPVDS